MTFQTDGLTVRIAADTGQLKSDLEEVSSIAERVSESLGSSLTTAFEDAIIRGNSLSDVLRNLALELSQVALNAALQPVRQAATSAFGNIFSGIFAADGAVLRSGRVTPFAQGGVVSGPTAFPLRGGAGVMGEAGPEAIMPLARGADGSLGVRAQSGGAPINVTVNVSTPDAGSFRRSEAQIAGVMSRALARAQRNQ